MKPSSHPASLRLPRFAAFSLVELLAVLAVLSVMTGLLVPVIGSISGGRDLGTNARELAGTLNQARTHAMAHATYVYACFLPREEEGKFRLIILASVSGIGAPADATSFTADLRAVSRPIDFKNAVLDDVSATALPDRTAADAQLASTTAPSPALTWKLPNSSSDTTFQHIIRFNPRGEAEIVAGPSGWKTAPLVEIGLCPAKGGQKLTSHVAAIQLVGLTGQTRVFQP